ncbi:1572_t:CDS:2, partial [Cetraspora pellucida]
LIPCEILVARARRLISFFMSPKQSERLEQVQLKINISEDQVLRKTDHYLRLIADTKTRWNSSYLAWKRLIKLRPAINVMISILETETDRVSKREVKQLKKINLTNTEWDTIKELLPILKPFAEATEFLGGSSYSTISFMFYVISILASDLALNDNNDTYVMIDFESSATAFDDDIIYEDADEEVDEITSGTRRIRINTPQNCNGLIKQIKVALNKSLHHYYSVPSEVGTLAALLDPQFASLQSNHEEFQQSTKSDNSLIARIFQLHHPQIDEVTDYLAQPQISPTHNPFSWWINNQERFPTIIKLAQKYLSIPATSTPSERLFSDAGNIMSSKRTNLKPQ